MTTYLGKSFSFCLPRVPFVNCRQFMYLVISLLVLRAGYGIWLYQFLIIAYLFTFQYHTCLMVYKSITGQTPEYISSVLTYVSEHHEKQTRSTVLDLLHIPRSHSAYFDRAFSVQGPKLWNSLPADIRNSTSINMFKRELKRYLLYITKMR